MDVNGKKTNDEKIVEPKKSKKSKSDVKIEELTLKVNELNEKYLRTLAESENFKKRIQQEKIIDRKYAATNFAYELLTPFEQLDKIVEIKTDNDLLNNYLVGFKMIRDQFKTILEQEGVKEIKALDEPFDFNVHHAVEKVEIKDKPNGLVVEVLQKGYHFKDRVLRPAMVKVNEWSDENGEDK